LPIEGKRGSDYQGERPRAGTSGGDWGQMKIWKSNKGKIKGGADRKKDRLPRGEGEDNEV